MVANGGEGGAEGGRTKDEATKEKRCKGYA